jgi:hypothetical protein
MLCRPSQTTFARGQSVAKSIEQPAPGHGPIRTRFQRCWFWLRDRWRSIEDLRFHFGLLALGALLVLAVPQGRDVMATLSDAWAPGSTGHAQWWWFFASVVFLGLQSWLWARLLIQLRHGHRRGWRRDRLLVQLPRLLGVFPYFAAASAFLRVPQGPHLVLQALALAAAGIAAYLFYWKRLALAARIGSWAFARHIFQDELRRVPLSRFEFAILLVSVALSATSILWLIVDPVTLPETIGSAAAAYLAFALVIPVVSLMLALVWRERFPVLRSLLLLALLSSIVNDNHAIRTLPARPPARPDLRTAYRTWLRQAPTAQDDPQSVPVVLVSAAGGASRAALWTLASLQHLDGDDAGFNHSIFAITAVSGSGLGAVDYIATADAVPGEDTAGRHALGWDHAGRDFLAPAIGGFLYTDMVQRFLPYPLLRDRAWSIERGFERGWDESCRDQRRGADCAGLLQRPFLDLWAAPRARWRPNLLLVGTVQEDGRRIATSNIDLVEQTRAKGPGGIMRTWRRPLLPNVYDFFEASGRSIAASTAVMNTARFPYVSPAGGIVRAADGSGRGHIIDGGYFEASAADTNVDLANAIIKAAADLCAREQRCLRPRIIFLTLLNDEMVDGAAPSDPPDVCDPDARHMFEDGRIVPAERLIPAARSTHVANDALAPIAGLLHAQGAHAELTLTRLAREDPNDKNVPAECRSPGHAVAAQPGTGSAAYEIRLLPCREPSERGMAMSWVLSEPTRRRMLSQLAPLRLSATVPPRSNSETDCGFAQQQEMSRLAKALGMPGGPSPP